MPRARTGQGSSKESSVSVEWSGDLTSGSSVEEEVSTRKFTMEELELLGSVRKRSFGASWT